MKKLFLYMTVLAAAACSSTKQGSMNSSQSNEAGKDGWISLFDGKTTKGWHTYGKKTIGKAWVVSDGALHLDAAAKNDWQTAEGGDILTDGEYDNFHLKLEWKIAPKGNSGVIFYIHEDTTKYKYPWNTGPEMQVLDNGTATEPGHPDGKLISHRAGDLYDLIVSKETVKRPGEWNQAEIIADHGKLEFRLNGQTTLTTTMWDDNWRALIAKSKFKDMAGFGTFKKGRIALQDHGDNVWYRNIMIKRM